MRRICLVLAVATASVFACHDRDNPSFAPPGDVGDGGPGAGDDGGPGEGDGSTNPDGSVIVTGSASLLAGTILGESGPFEGEVLVDVTGNLACVAPGTACESDPAAAGLHPTTVDIVAPGLIDTHNHILFDVFDGDDWLPSQVYTNHNQWTSEPRYNEMVDVKQCLSDASQGKPTWCPASYHGTGSVECEMEKWGSLKGLVAGTTSIVGLAGTSHACFATLARPIDTSENGLGTDKIQTSALFPPSKTTADGVCANYASGKTAAFVIHVGEGTDATSLAEFGKLGTVSTTQGCLYAAGTAITHGTAFTATEFGTMAANNMKLTWSPASNVALYGATADIPTALDAGVVVALGPDWSMGGSQNLLDEMRFAKSWSDAHFSGRLTAQDIVAMATKNAAAVLDLQDRLGTLKKGYVADLFAVHGDKTKPYDAILAATPKEVALTMVGGHILYGDAALKSLGAGGVTCEDFDACGGAKFVCAAQPGVTHDKLDQTYAQIKAALDQGMIDMDANRTGGGAPFVPLTPVVTCH